MNASSRSANVLGVSWWGRASGGRWAPAIATGLAGGELLGIQMPARAPKRPGPD